MTCKHQHLIRIPDFPGDAMVCRDCGSDVPQPGYNQGIRDYYVFGDPPWRRAVEVRKREWIATGNIDDLEQCPACLFVGTIDDFDVMGCEDGFLFCNQCGVMFEQEPAAELQRRLFA